jgi:hypothetical protein
MIRHLHGYQIHGSGHGPFVIRQGPRLFATYRKLRDARDAVRALARGDTRRAVTSFQGQRELEFRR